MIHPPNHPGAPPPASHDPFAPGAGIAAAYVAPPAELIPGWPARRLAGIALIFTGITTVVDLLMAVDLGDSVNPRGILPIVFDFIIGGSLLLGSERFLGWAILRAALGAVLWSVIHAMQGNYVAIPLQLLVSSALLLLLVGHAGKVRTIAGLAAFALYLLGFGLLVALYAMLTASGIDVPAQPSY